MDPIVVVCMILSALCGVKILWQAGVKAKTICVRYWRRWQADDEFIDYEAADDPLLRFESSQASMAIFKSSSLY